MSYGSQWICVSVSGDQEALARRIRAERDRHYQNVFREERGDERWVGDLGEIVFDAWSGGASAGFTWIRDDAAGRADFISPSGVTIGVKTVKRKVPPRPDYTAQITARHAEEPVDQFFFMSYEIALKKMWLLGGIDRVRFLREARFYGAGEMVHANYEIRPGHEIYNIAIGNLLAPGQWLGNVRG